MKTTLKDIARASGYSVTTVSRALGGFDDVNEQTRAHIAQIAADLGYQPNLVARQLKSQRAYTLGLVMPLEERQDEDGFFNILLKGVIHVAALHHYDVLISAQPPGASEMEAYRAIVGGHRVDGMLLARTYADDPRIPYLKEVGCPFVVSGRAGPDQHSDFPYIDADSRAGLKMMVDHLVAGGHRRIGLILPPPEIAYTPYRLAGYRDGLEAAGLPSDAQAVIHGDLTIPGGQQAAASLLKRVPGLTAIIACNDLMALGAMRAVQGRGLRVGSEFAIGGFDDIPAAEHGQPGLTTIRQPIRAIGERLTEMLIAIIEGRPPEEKGILLMPELVVRESSGGPRP